MYIGPAPMPRVSLDMLEHVPYGTLANLAFAYHYAPWASEEEAFAGVSYAAAFMIARRFKSDIPAPHLIPNKGGDPLANDG